MLRLRLPKAAAHRLLPPLTAASVVSGSSAQRTRQAATVQYDLHHWVPRQDELAQGEAEKQEEEGGGDEDDDDDDVDEVDEDDEE